jgi:two-component system sensor histidine kinase ChiS
MLTAKTQVGDMVRGFDCGANDYLTKPVNREELLSRIKTGLQLKQFADLLRENQTLKDEIVTRKLVEKELTSVNQRLMGLLDIWDTGIIVVDHHHSIQFFNQRAEEIFGCAHHEVYAQPIQSLMPNLTLPAKQFKTQYKTLTIMRGDNAPLPMEIIVTPIDVKGDTAYAIVCRNATDDSGMEQKIDIAYELSQTHQKIQVLQSAFDSALRFLDQEGRHMAEELENITASMEKEFNGLSKKEIEVLFRQTIVEVMTDVLEAWERATGKNKIQFAEESKIWRVYLDADVYKTRTLDKYMNIDKLPKNPHYKDVIKSVEFVLTVFPESNPLKTRLQASLPKLRALIKAR